MEKRPKVGMGIIVMKDGKVLLHKRKGAHGEGTWCFPGGHLEFNESLEECARRETMEEAGIEIENVRFSTITNDIHRNEGVHYITIYMIADHKSGEPRIMEPEKCEGWEWFEWNEFPEPLFLPLKNLLMQGYDPFRQ